MTTSSTTSSQTKNQNQISTTLLNKILDAIETQNLSYVQMVNSMGYHSDSTHSKAQAKAVKRLQHVLSLADLGLSDSNYDFKYSSSEFIHALCHVLNIAKEECIDELNQLELHAHQVLTARMPTAYAGVSYNDDYKPSFSMAVYTSKFTHVKLDKDIRLLSTYKQLQAILKAIKRHYATVTGNIPFDGVVDKYRISLYGLDAESDKQILIIPADFD